MTDCEHAVIQTWRTDDGVARLWACADCWRRFAPTEPAPAASPEWPPDVSCVHLPGHPDDCDKCGCGAATASAAATSEEGE